MPEQEYDEIDLVDYLQVILKWKTLILSLTTLFVLGGLAKSFQESAQYSSEALILLSPNHQLLSQQTSDHDQRTESHLDVETYVALANSDELTTTLSDSLHQLFNEGAIGPSYFSYGLVSELLKPTATSQSPLLALRVTSADSNVALFVTNLWSELFLERHRGLSSGAAKSYHEWVSAQYEIATKSLANKEDTLQFIESNHHELSILQNEINIKNGKLEETLSSYQTHKIDLEDKEKEIKHLQQLLKSLTYRGKWIGYYKMNELPQSLSSGSEIRKDLLNTMQALETLAQDSLQIVRDHNAQAQSLDLKSQDLRIEFERKTQVSILRNRISFLNTTLSSYQQESAGQEQKLKELMLQLDTHQKSLSEQPSVLTLSKAITDDALWNQVQSNQNALKKFDALKLRSEEHNPIYQQLSAQVNNFKLEKMLLESRLSFITQEIPKIEQKVSIALNRLDSIQTQEQTLKYKLSKERQALNQTHINERDPVLTHLNLYREVFHRHRDFFLARQHQLEQLEQDLIMQRSEFQFAKRQFSNWRSELTRQTRKIQTLQLERTRLERNVAVYRETVTRFSRLFEEARIALQQASGDIQIVSRASQYQTLHPSKYKTLIIAALGGLFLSVFLSFSLEYFQKARNRLNQEPHFK